MALTINTNISSLIAQRNLELATSALTSGKPILWYESNTECYFIDTITLSGTDIILTKGGKTITIENDSDITEVGDINNLEIEGLQAELYTIENLTIENIYTSACKNGDKITIVSALNLTRLDTLGINAWVANIKLPSYIMEKLFPTNIGAYDCLAFNVINSINTDLTIVPLNTMVFKGDNNIQLILQQSTIDNLVLNKKTYVRFELTFLLSDNLINE